MVVAMYNEMATTLTSVERPLVEADLNTIDQNLQAGLLEHNWQSNNIQTYIAELLEMVRAVFGTVKAMKGNLKEVERIMKAAAAKPLIQVRNFCFFFSLSRLSPASILCKIHSGRLCLAAFQRHFAVHRLLLTLPMQFVPPVP